ncbi:MAG: VWA domain-containing protein [Acidobacteriota bacterium]|jgi:VWFA-related protein|nr:VWA domain-containing protein [Acidobacteriota bacterium]
MRYKNNLCLALITLSVLSISLVSNIDVFAQSKKGTFGSSLEKFEKGKSAPKDKEQNNQKSNTPPDDGTIRVDTNLIISDVLVVNEKGNPVIGLNQSDFIVKEDTKPQKIELFSFGANASLPRSIVLIFFNGRYSRYDRENNLRAAKYLVDKLAPNDKMAIVTLDVNLALDFTTDKKLLKKTLNSLSDQRRANPSVSRTYGTLMAVLGEMFDEKDVRPIVVLQTPGGELWQLKETDLLKLPEDAPSVSELYQRIRKKISKEAKADSDKAYPERGYGFSDILETVERSRATIYSIIPDMRFVGHSREEQLRRGRISVEDWMRRAVKETDLLVINKKADEYKENEADGIIINQLSMIQIATASGGLTNFIEQPKDAEKVYDDIFTIINNRYTIGYYSDNETQTDKPRSVKIEVRGHPEYKIIGRNSYIAPER